jgi:hypothetical protein
MLGEHALLRIEDRGGRRLRLRRGARGRATAVRSERFFRRQAENRRERGCDEELVLA